MKLVGYKLNSLTFLNFTVTTHN